MSKPKRQFKPTHYLDTTSIISLEIEVAIENGQSFVYAAFYDGLSRSYDKVTKSTVRTNSYGHTYFVKGHQRYYLADFMSKSLF